MYWRCSGIADVAPARKLIALLTVFAPALAVGLSHDGAVAALRFADAAGGEHQVDRAQDVLHAIGVMLDATRVEQKARARGAPPLGRLRDGALGHAGDLRRPRQRPLPAVVGDLVETGRVGLDERAVDPVALDHDLEDAGKQRRVPARLDGQVQVARARHRRDARVLHDDLRALLAGLPDVVGRDRRALRDVRTGDPDDLGAHHVGPRVGRAIDAEGLLVGGARADHAQPAVVVDERRLQAHARELAEQVRLLRRETGAAEHADGARAVRGLETSDLRCDARDCLVVGHRAEPGGRRFIAAERGQQAIGVRPLQVALDALRAQHAAIERKLLPRLEADDLVVAHLQLNPALLSAEAAVGLDQALRFDAGRQPHARHRRQVGAEAVDDA